MLAPHLNPRIDAHMRFRLALQVSNVKKLVESPKNVWMMAYSLAEVRRYRRVYPYGWQVAGTTLDNLFRKYEVPWDDEDEEKVAAGHVRASTPEDRSFWMNWLRPPPERLRPVTRPANELPSDLRQLIMSFVPKPEKPKPPEPTFDVETRTHQWWQDPRMYGDF